MPAAMLSPTQTTLLAASLASSGDIPRLKALIAQNRAVFAAPETLLRVLLCLPETAAPASYAPLIEKVDAEDADGDLTIDFSPVETLSEKTAKRQLHRILPPLPPADDPVIAFLAARAERIDTETGALSIAAELLLPFVESRPEIRDLYESYLQVLSKLVYTFGREQPPGLAAFRALKTDEALVVLLADVETVVRDLRELVEPYLARRENEWRKVWARLEGLEFGRWIQMVKEWTPPEPVREEFATWAIGRCYHTKETTEKVWEGMRRVQQRAGELMGGKMEHWTLPETLGDLHDTANHLFRPTRQALGLFDTGITASALLGKPLAETMKLRLEGNAESQGAVLRQFVRAGTTWDSRDDEAWKKVRDGARWLRNKAEVLGKLSVSEVEKVVLSGMLAGLRFGLVRDVYVTSNSTCGLSLEEVEKCVLAAFNDFVDNATNGNKTRGRMKNALQTIQTLYPHTSTSPALSRANSLISAIHALSNYTLPSSNRSSSPLLPVQIRIHADPLSLLSKLLASNTRSYQRPDALIQIGCDLVFGTGADMPSADIEARILGMCAEAALGEEDFESAYAYITSRLLPAAQAGDAEEARNTLWRMALQAGRWRSSYALLSDTAPKGPAALATLEKKRELLAWALAHCPSEAAADVLGSWRKNEEEIEVLMEAEERAEEEHAKLGGIKTRRASVAREGEGPQSLFDVARGAARVFTTQAAGGEQEKRERKRDVVSGMVTRGLVGGIGWVLGAQPNLDQGR